MTPQDNQPTIPASAKHITGKQLDIRGGLTFKQDSFAKKLAEGFSLTDAYDQAYPSDKRSRSVSATEGLKLRNNPKIVERVKYYIDKQERYSSYNPAQLRSVAIQTIMQVAQNERAKDADRLKAAELLGKITNVGLFDSGSNQQPVVQINTMIDLEQRLKQLAARAQSNQVIDITEESNPMNK